LPWFCYVFNSPETADETPSFTLDFRNEGFRNFRVFQSPLTGSFVVDGISFGWTRGLGGKASSPFPPGRAYEGIRVSLDDDRDRCVPGANGWPSGFLGSGGRETTCVNRAVTSVLITKWQGVRTLHEEEIR